MFLLDFDQYVTLAINGSHCLWLDSFALSITSTLFWLPAFLALLLLVVRHSDMRGIVFTCLAVALCVLIADQLSSSFTKPLVGRFRPTNEPLIMLAVDVVDGYRGGRYGFYSSHAANTFAVATFLSYLIRQHTLSRILYFWALLNCWSRIYLGVHYFGDVVVGIIVGILVGYLVWRLYRRFAAPIVGLHERTDYAGLTAQTATGYTIADARLAGAVFIALIAFAAIRGFWML